MVVVRMGGNHVSDFIGKNTYASQCLYGPRESFHFKARHRYTADVNHSGRFSNLSR